jgi:tetratricopeptide (TPR) repeat protein
MTIILTFIKRNMPVLPALILLLLTSPAFPQTAEQNTFISMVKKGAEQLKAGNYQAAKESFLEALHYDDEHAAAHLGLGLAYFHLRDDRYAEIELSKASVLDPNSSDAYQWLGELCYRKDDLEGAIRHWEKAVELNPSDGNLRARLERIRREHRTEKDFNRDVTSHFLVKFEGREKIEAGKIVLRILEDAYGEVGRALAFYPDHEIQVILYSGQQFQEVTEAPGWSGGIFDGKIRIPVGGIENETPGLRKLLYHEYTHAVVRAISPRCPTWLNEGLAQHLEGREVSGPQKDALLKLAQAGKLPSLAGLEGSFGGLSGNEAAFAYLFSLSAVKYMIDEFGMYRLKTMLEELSLGVDTGKAVDKAIWLSYEEFERGWKRSLE